MRCIFLDRGNHQSCWNRNYIYPLTYFDAIQECTKMHSGWIGFQKWQQAFWFLWTIFFFFLIIGFFLLNCETLYQFNFEMDWRATKGCCCWFHNHTFDRKKFFSLNRRGEITKNHHKVWTPNVLPFENKSFVCFDHNAIYTHSSVSTFNW